MISGLGTNERGREALQLYEELKKSFEPDDITVATVIAACSQSGLVDEALHIFHFERMSVVNPDTFSAMIHCLSRAGKVNDAELMLNELGDKADVASVAAILRGCIRNMDVARAERVFEKLKNFHNERALQSAYLLMSKMYDLDGQMTKANDMRKEMDSLALKKIPAVESNSFEIESRKTDVNTPDVNVQSVELGGAECHVAVQKDIDETIVADEHRKFGDNKKTVDNRNVEDIHANGDLDLSDVRDVKTEDFLLMDVTKTPLKSARKVFITKIKKLFGL